MTTPSENESIPYAHTPGIPKPWEHRMRLEVDRKEWDDAGGEDAVGMIASCSCGDFAFPFVDGMDPAEVLDHTQPHIETHPLPPLSIAKMGNGDFALVMSVPGPENKPVHMTITVSEEVFNDGARLAHHIGMIGSPMHFAAQEQRENLKDAMKNMGFRAIELPVGGVDRVLDLLKDMRMPRPEQLTGILQEPVTIDPENLIQVSETEREDENAN